MAELSNPIIEDGTYTLDIAAGKYYACGASGDWGGSGSLAVNWTDVNGVSVPFPDSPLTADGGFVFCAPAGLLTLVLSGSTSPSINITIAPTTISA